MRQKLIRAEHADFEGVAEQLGPAFNTDPNN